jgi:hypothetical protein
MKRLFVLTAIVYMLLSLALCKSIFGPDAAAKIVIDGQLSINLTSYGCPVFQGWVKNTGEKTAYNCMVKVIVYSDSAKRNIIDSGSGFPANLGDITPGTRAYFEAVCFNLSAVSQVIAYDTDITWLERK